MAPLIQAVRVEASVDWFSMTIPIDRYPAADMYYEAQDVIERIADDGNEAKERYLLGHAGISAGNCFAGVGESTYYVQLTGSNAERWWKGLYRVEGHVSRLDIQCTAFFERLPTTFGVDTFKIANDAAAGKGDKPKWTVTQNSNNKKGYSIYIGSKDSEHFAIIYNKEAESGNEHYKNAWRYEVRLKNDYGTKAAYALFSRQNNYQEAIAASVGSWFAKRGIQVPWKGLSSESILAGINTSKTDKDKVLWWMEKQVRPALDKARKLGYYSDACRALGLAEHPFYTVSRETGLVEQFDA